MKAETFMVKVCGLLVVIWFVFDSYRKYTLATEIEGERVRIKFG